MNYYVDGVQVGRVKFKEMLLKEAMEQLKENGGYLELNGVEFERSSEELVSEEGF